ncbi:MAG: gamma-glutamyl-gamma-aminobutyrate hydrolase family protein, partial [Nitrospinota bacterium]
MSSKKPIIGILCDINKEEGKEDRPLYFVKSNYVSATKEAGGIPLIIPPLKDKNDLTKTLNLIDGLLIPGGDDIDPKYFKEEPHPSVVLIDPEIIQFQMDFCRKALNKGIPVFGICAGLQIINIACGGNIYQDIPSQYSNPIKHKKDEDEKEDPTHNVKIERSTKLYNILQKGEISVNSTHHQALKDVAEGFMVTARSEDGTIEAIENRKHRFIIGVQWHP